MKMNPFPGRLFKGLCLVTFLYLLTACSEGQSPEQGTAAPEEELIEFMGVTSSTSSRNLLCRIASAIGPSAVSLLLTKINLSYRLKMNQLLAV